VQKLAFATKYKTVTCLSTLHHDPQAQRVDGPLPAMYGQGLDQRKHKFPV